MTKYFSKDGEPIEGLSHPVRASELKEIYKMAKIKNDFGIDEVKPARDQYPFVVTLYEYQSALTPEPQSRYVFVYAKEAGAAQAMAVKRWKATYNPQFMQPMCEGVYPQLEGAATMEVISDEEFSNMWEFLRKDASRYISVGHPEDPFIIIVRDNSIDLHKTVASDSGLTYSLNDAIRAVEKSNNQHKI